MKQKICIVTGSRAEYGLYRSLMMQIRSSSQFALQIVVTGAHLEPEFGSTYKEILSDGFKISAKVRIASSGESKLASALSSSKALSGIAKAFSKLKPDLVLVLGDRYEMFAAAFAAHLLTIPIAHIHGGEVTEGSLDDSMRHAITKLSTIHFTTTAEYRKRVIQLGEPPKLVYNTGAPGVENILAMKLLDKDELQAVLKIELTSPLAVITMHPATHEKISTVEQIKAMLHALKRMGSLQMIITYPNADAEGARIIKEIESFQKQNSSRAFLFRSLGAKNYLSLLKYADVVIGNSSSGIIEVPSFGIPTVNIGDRQKSRIAAASVIHVKPDDKSIYSGIRKALNPAFRKSCRAVSNPYENGRTSEKILSVLKKYKNFRTIEKKFYDL
jgi:GDP/UDP-N,N'-diacetylbacillosamine 2-epimerase (hydrolysing)